MKFRVMMLFQESEAAKKSAVDLKAELGEVKKECHKRKKMLIAQQQMLQAGANAYNKVWSLSPSEPLLPSLFAAFLGINKWLN